MDNGMKNALEKRGYIMTPYRITAISKAVDRVAGALFDGKASLLSAEDAQIVLDMVRELLNRATEAGQ